MRSLGCSVTNFKAIELDTMVCCVCVVFFFFCMLLLLAWRISLARNVHLASITDRCCCCCCFTVSPLLLLTFPRPVDKEARELSREGRGGFHKASKQNNRKHLGEEYVKMSLSVSQSVRDEMVAALLLAFDYTQGILETGIGTKKVNGLFRNALARGARWWLPCIVSIFILLLVTLHKRVLNARRRQLPDVIISSERSTNPPSNNIGTESSNGRNIEGEERTGMRRSHEAQRVIDAYFGPANNTVVDDFDADGHVQKLLKHFNPSNTTTTTTSVS
ncbi:hypothetical protein MOQ_001927 [Trypanosoma cruzi marinkellei]|uniref:Uncharacterized protein n=1 Tax=Trypanosoma cruzi marinkellei TaxID=85056 RepID=K2P9T9_TRYCR|nr:hypothetical protein MOQ_001927 [Trypanosoma cruzi marinkellei]